MEAKEALERFFEEKEIEHRTFTVEHNGIFHMVESDFVQNLIIHHTSETEQEQIREIIAKIDFQNGDVQHFLEHLAQGYVKANY